MIGLGEGEATGSKLSDFGTAANGSDLALVRGTSEVQRTIVAAIPCPLSSRFLSAPYPPTRLIMNLPSGDDVVNSWLQCPVALSPESLPAKPRLPQSLQRPSSRR